MILRSITSDRKLIQGVSLVDHIDCKEIRVFFMLIAVLKIKPCIFKPSETCSDGRRRLKSLKTQYTALSSSLIEKWINLENVPLCSCTSSQFSTKVGLTLS